MSNKDDEARKLARTHYEIEAGITQILRINDCSKGDMADRASEPIILLEVNENTVPSGVMPIQFGPNPAAGIHYPSVIIEVTPEEYVKIRSKELDLPPGWRVAEPISREEVGIEQ
jgi:hypothetical protein